jgi:hypothetical protein
MTQSGTESRPAISVGQQIGQALGQAQSVLSGLLEEAVAQAGTKRETYLALQRLGALGDAAAADDYARDLVDWLDVDMWSAGELANGLVAAGLITAEDGTVTIAAGGAQLRAQVAGLIGAVSKPLYEQLSQSDVETTVRTLRGITTRARALHSADRAQENGDGS